MLHRKKEFAFQAVLFSILVDKKIDVETSIYTIGFVINYESESTSLFIYFHCMISMPMSDHIKD